VLDGIVCVYITTDACFADIKSSLTYSTDILNIVFTVHLIYIKNQDQLDAKSLLKSLIVVLH
jgi:hypothetical protein